MMSSIARSRTRFILPLGRVHQIERVKPEIAILTNLHVDPDYQILKSELPDGVIPA